MCELFVYYYFLFSDFMIYVDRWMDDWISSIYGYYRTILSENLLVCHHLSRHGQRYKVKLDNKRYLVPATDRGRLMIRNYMLKHEIEATSLDQQINESIYKKRISKGITYNDHCLADMYWSPHHFLLAGICLFLITEPTIGYFLNIRHSNMTDSTPNATEISEKERLYMIATATKAVNKYAFSSSSSSSSSSGRVGRRKKKLKSMWSKQSEYHFTSG
jgi:hypothetical protein